MTKEITKNVFWINLCNPPLRPGGHAHQSVYLLMGERTLLIDTGPPQQWDLVLRAVEEVLDGRTLDYLFFTHPEILHMGNLPRWMERYPGAQVVGGNPPAVVGTIEPSRYQQVLPRELLELRGVAVEFVRPVILDLPDTLWVYERNTRVLFPVDGWAYRHDQGQCHLLADEMQEEVNADLLVDFYDRLFPWLKFTRSDDLSRELERLFQEHEVRVLAPAHGKVSYDPAWYLRLQEEALHRLAAINSLA